MGVDTKGAIDLDLFVAGEISGDASVRGAIDESGCSIIGKLSGLDASVIGGITVSFSVSANISEIGGNVAGRINENDTSVIGEI